MEDVKKWEKFRQTEGLTDKRTDSQTDDGQQLIRKAHSVQVRLKGRLSPL